MKQPDPTTLLTQVCIFERYGPRLNVDQLAEIFGLRPASIRNAISAGTFPVATYVDGVRRFADYRDVAAHIDAKRAEAREAQPT